MRRRNRGVASICIAAILLAALLPGLGLLDGALVEPHWTLLPEEVVSFAPPHVSVPGEQPVALLSSGPSRAPPVLPIW